ncbi:MAG TPA: hypothetical protein DCZ95_07550 [Verrucomicrobia bacterium]|nr:MAG: hypothetical protein A2X46_01255 [Lentisphaerae bacterium GWF2_57_35]HBA83930.1 hypothetical protein [Verrucomicrobiota bacterium]
MQISPESVLHLVHFFRLAQQFIQGHEDAGPASGGAFRASGAGLATGFELPLLIVFHTSNNLASRY